MKKRKDVHLVCNAHIDPIWQWDWQEGVSATLSTFYTAVRLSKKYDYIFCHNEVTVYKYIEEYAPELFKEIQQLVKAGKWHIMGGWYLQPDANMPSGESFVRQIQEGKRYFMEKFGVFPTTALNLDQFGHTAGLPQILKKCGQDSYLSCRPWTYELFPSDQFWWKGFDGSTVKALRAAPYSTPLGNSVSVIKERVADRKHEEVSLIMWGVGNHGGGPSDKDLADIQALMQEAEENYIHSTPEQFFAAMQPSFTYDKSLRLCNPGTYSSMYTIKKKHALLENELCLTEKMLSAAYAKGALKCYPEEKIHEITQDLLNAEFHDVLPGSSIQCGEDNGLKLLNHGLLEAERLKTRAYFALTSECSPAAEGEYPIVVFNPNAYPLTTNIECEFMLAAQNWEPGVYSRITVLDEQGNEVKFQRIKEESNLNLDWRKRIIFEADLKPFALNRYSVYVRFEPPTEKQLSQNLVYNDGRKYVEIDGKTGLLKKYAVDGVTYAENAFSLVSFADNADPWGMGNFQLSRMGQGEEEAFTLSQIPTGVFEGMKSVQVVEDGDIYWGVEAFFEQKNTRARIGYKVYKNNDFIDVNVDLFMGDINRIIKLKVPMDINGTLIGQTAFATEDLYMDGRENVAHRFLALETGDKALALMNSGVYGSHFENGALYQTLVRGVTYCAHPIEDRMLIPDDRFTKKIDQGESNFSFRFGVVKRDELDRKTQEFVQKPYGLNIFPIPNQSKLDDFSIRLDDEIVTLVTMKKADGREGFVLRLHNNTAHAVNTGVTLNNAYLPLAFGKFEVKTVLYENGRLTELDEMII